MSASGAVQPGPPGAAVGPSPAAVGSPATGPLFRPLSAEDEEQQPTKIESLCMNCYRNGTTRLLLTKIPFFREIIVSSFSCEHCGWNNTEIQSAGRIQDQGVRYTLTVKSQEDMNREVVKTDSATTRIPELDFEIPAFSQKGALTTIEGLISRAISGLEQDQPTRRRVSLCSPGCPGIHSVDKAGLELRNPPASASQVLALKECDTTARLELFDKAHKVLGLKAVEDGIAERIDEFIGKLKDLKQMASPFTLIIDDPSGNSFVENPHAPQKDNALVITYYDRTPQQAEMLGLQAEAPEEKAEEEDLRNEVRGVGSLWRCSGVVLQFNTNCPECNAPAQTNMKLVRIFHQAIGQCFILSEIPHFKEVIIMATNCENCGHRTNEVKSGGAVEALGTRITLHITDPSDMTRDLLKSETCSVEIPELEFELGMAVLGGKFTTLEGLLKDIRELVTKNPFTLGDSSNPDQSEKLQEFSQKLGQIIEGKMKAHFIMNDPAGNSYLQNVYAPEDDPEMKVERYKRTFDQNEELGLNDMKTEGYEAGQAPQR
ncbi:Zinc finger protein ZPR1 [Apodemus speciosus]|uniref:Zinc finger protein ZPR1 n=1 Tax=Apodemus speciosus TaxID=105296 RepID=A0ABQ0F4F5_APOSI